MAEQVAGQKVERVVNRGIADLKAVLRSSVGELVPEAEQVAKGMAEQKAEEMAERKAEEMPDRVAD